MSSFFNLGYQKEGAGRPAPTEGAALFFYQLYTYFWNLLFINLIFILSCLPIVTIPAAFSALNRTCIKLIRDKNVLFWMEYRDEFKKSFKRSLWLGIFFAVIAFICYYLLSLGLTNEGNMYGVLFTIFGAAIGIITAVWCAYTFVLLACLDLPSRKLRKNATALMALDRIRALIVLGILALAVIVMFGGFPISLVLLLLGGPVLTQYSICWVVNTPMQKWIIGPYEQEMTGAQQGD